MLTSVIKRCLYKRKLLGFVAPNSRIYHAASKVQHRWACARFTSLTKPNAIVSRPYSNIPDYSDYVDLPPVDNEPFKFPGPFQIPVVFPLKLFFQVILGLDRNFNLPEFLESTKQAVAVISKALANEDCDSLEGLVTEDMLEKLRVYVSKLNSEQKRLLAVDPSDVICQYAHDLNINNVERSDGTVEQILQIDLLFHYYPKLSTIDRADLPPIFQLIQKCILCNYRFQRTYVNKEGGSWIVAYVNYLAHGSVKR